ncbi:hypothetical protein ACA910_004258 [Epithemia clementina (nom. ined.)]
MQVLSLLVVFATTTVAVAALHGIRPSLSTGSLAHRSAAKAGICIKVASKEKGLGAFATCDLKVGDYIGEYKGEKLTRRQVQARYWGKQAKNRQDLTWEASRLERGQGVTGNYVLEMKDGSFVDAEDADRSSWCRFMNHATEGSNPCNVKAFDRIRANGDLLVFPQFFAIRDIQAGEELLWDYGPHSDVAQSWNASK